jgi:hypothetical protein
MFSPRAPTHTQARAHAHTPGVHAHTPLLTKTHLPVQLQLEYARVP